MGNGPLSTVPDYWAILHDSLLGQGGSTYYHEVATNPIVPDTLLPVPFGQVRVSGTFLYVQGFDNQNYGRGVIAWSEGEIESIDALVPYLASHTNDYVIMVVDHHHGESGGNTNPGGLFGGSQPSFANVAYTYFSVQTHPGYPWIGYIGGSVDSNGYAGTLGATRPTADIHGLKLYDPRLDSTNGGSGTQRYADPTTWTYSNNPILICRYLFVKYGHLINGVDIDDANIAAMAQTSDDAGFSCNIVFTTKTLLSDALTAVLQTCNGQPIDVNGKAGFYLDIPNPGAVAGSFSEEDGDIYGLKYEWLSARDRYTQVAVSFLNKDADYAPDQTPFFGDPGTFSSEPIKTVSSVNTTTDTLTMASSPGWSVNDTVLFFQYGGVAIPGLSDGATYYVKTISGAAVTLALAAGGTVVNLTGSPSITTQYLQRVGIAYPPTVVVKQLIVNAPGVNTLAAAIILRNYSYNASAITFRISGTMNGRGILLQQGQKIHLKTLKGIDADFLLIQIPGDAQGFFSFVAKPYSAGTYSSTPITQGPPIVPSTRPNDINVTDRTQTLEVLTSTDSTHDNYDVFQLMEYILPLNYAATIDHLAVRGSEASGAQSRAWDDLAASEISVATAGNATATDSTHENLYHTAVRRATRVITYSTRPTVLTDVTTENTTRIIVKSISADGSASTGVTTDYTAGVGPSAPPPPSPFGFTSPLVIPPSGTITGLGGELQMKELAANGTNVTGFGAPDTLAADLRYVLPATAPSIDGQALVWDGVSGGYAGRKILTWDLPWVEKLMIETPSGAWTGRVYTISELPLTAKITLVVDNVTLTGGVDYGRSGQTITLAIAANKPVNSIVALYSYRGQVGSAVSSSETLPPSGTADAWSAETIDATKAWECVAFSPTLGTGQGMFAAIASDGTTTDIATSIDGGVTWVPQTTPTAYGASWMTILWDGSRFCAAQYNNNCVLFSADGVLWTEAYTTSGPTPYKAIWVAALGLYIATGMSSGSGALLSSTDFLTWTFRAASNAAAVCWSDTLGLLVAVGTNSVQTSTNGLSWATGTPVTGDPVSATWSPGIHLFVIAGAFTLGGFAVGIATSPDGFAWTIQPTPNPGTYGLGCVVWSDARQLLVALKSLASDGEATDKAIFTSPDGFAWASQPTATFAGQWLVCADSIDTLVAVASAGTVRVIQSVA